MIRNLPAGAADVRVNDAGGHARRHGQLSPHRSWKRRPESMPSRPCSAELGIAPGRWHHGFMQRRPPSSVRCASYPLCAETSAAARAFAIALQLLLTAHAMSALLSKAANFFAGVMSMH